MAEGGSAVAELFVKLGLIPDKEEFEKGDEMIEKVKKGLEFFAGFEAVKGLFELVEHTTEAAVANKHLAEKLGTSIEAVQELSYAADVTGASVDDMRISLQHLSTGIEHAAKTGKGPLVDGLSKLKIGFAEFKKAKPEERIEMLADAFKKAGPGVDKTSVAMDVFGRKGTALIPLLNKGGEGVKELRQEFVELGAETTAEDAEKLEKMEEQQKKIKYMWGGLKDEVVMSLLPVLMEVLKGFFEWAKANRELIAGTLKAAIMVVVEALKIFGAIMAKVAEVINFFAEHAELARAVLIGLGATIAMVMGPAIAAWIEAKAVILLVVAAFSALALAVSWVGEEIGKAMDGDLGAIAFVALLGGILVGVVLPALITGLQMLAAYVAFIVIPALASAAAATWAWTVALLANPIVLVAAAIIAAVFLIYKYWDDIADYFQNLWDGIKETASEVGQFFEDLWQGIKDGCVAAFTFIRNLPVLKQILDAIGAVGDFIGFVGDLFGGGDDENAQPNGAQTDASTFMTGKTAMDDPSMMVTGGAGDTTSNVTQTNNITINGTNLDHDDLAAAVKEGLDNHVRENYGAATGNQ